MKRLPFLIIPFLWLAACQAQADTATPAPEPTYDFNYVPTATLPSFDVAGAETRIGYNVQGWV